MLKYHGIQNIRYLLQEIDLQFYVYSMYHSLKIQDGGVLFQKYFFTLLFRTFWPLKVGMTPLGQKFELQIQVFDLSNTAE